MAEEQQQQNIVEGESQLGTEQTGATIDPNVRKDLEQFESIRKEFQDLKKDFITVFGIFASFVTFLSVEIQIFKTVTNFWLLLGLSSFLLAGILVFSFSISSMVKGKLEWKELNNPLMMFVGIFFAICIICFGVYAIEQKSVQDDRGAHFFIRTNI